MIWTNFLTNAHNAFIPLPGHFNIKTTELFAVSRQSLVNIMTRLMIYPIKEK
jgi:hypothetical protein